MSVRRHEGLPWLGTVVPLRKLGARDVRYEGIWSALAEGEALQGVTDQFLAEAETYHARYSGLEYFKRLIDTTLTHTGVTRDGPLRVLDLGSGSGNSVLPLLELLPAAEIVACDISPDLLALLQRHGLAYVTRFRERTMLVQMDAMRQVFESGTFDLIVGAAILHHLREVEFAIDACGAALRTGGAAIFFEPFENGSAILRLAFEEILNDRRAYSLHPKVTEFFRGMSAEYRLRAGRDKSAPHFAHVDDKWLFTRSHISECARRAGFVDVSITPLHSLSAPFSGQARELFRITEREQLVPEWVWTVLRRYDEAFSEDLLRDLPIEACVVLTKG